MSLRNVSVAKMQKKMMLSAKIVGGRGTHPVALIWGTFLEKDFIEKTVIFLSIKHVFAISIFNLRTPTWFY